MGKFRAIIIAAIAFTALNFANLNLASATLSARRQKSSPAALYIHAAQQTLVASGHYSKKGPVVWEKGAFKDAAWDRVPAISETDLQTSFELGRDEKAFDDTDASHKARRRATWLYPDDGCFVRAVIADDIIKKTLAVTTAKIFAFGNLRVKTENSPWGDVKWWYHVASIAKVTTKTGDKFYVYDPALDLKKPTEVHDWLKQMNDPNAEIAVCSGDAYDPNSDCAAGQANVYARAQTEATWYLQSEWDRLIELKRDPVRELGDFPPWL